MLTAKEKEKLTTLPEALQVYVSARVSPTIQSLSDYELSMLCLRTVKDAVECNGIPNKDNDTVIKNIYQQLAKDLKRPKYKNYGTMEIEEAICRGCRKEFGDYFACNISTIHGWIESYMKLKERNETINKFFLMLKEVHYTDKPTFLTVEESIQGCLNLFERYKASGNLDQLAFAYYDRINEKLGVEFEGKKTLVPDPEVRKKIVEETVTKHTEKLLAEKSRLEKRGFLSDAEAIMLKITEGFKTDKIIQFRQKRLMLKHYFDQLITDNKPLNLK